MSLTAIRPAMPTRTGSRLVAPPRAPRSRRGPILAIVLIASVTAGLLGTAGLMIATFPASTSAASCDPILQQVPTTGDRDELSTLSSSQLANADTIVQVGRRMGVSTRGLIVGVATAMQESTLINRDHGHLDSLGLFQQRDPWGSAAERMNPSTATEMFYGGGRGGQDGLLDIPGWDTLPVTVAADAVQSSALPGAYARWEVLAAQLVAAQAQTADISGCTTQPAPAAGADSPAAGADSPAADAAIGWARDQLGKPYRWGGAGPDSFDCSGLMMRAFEHAGITLPRISRDQYRAGDTIPRDQARLGDLVFWANNPANPATIRHVAVYLGDGQILEAPRTGVPVRTRELRDDERGLLDVAVRVIDGT